MQRKGNSGDILRLRISSVGRNRLQHDFWHGIPSPKGVQTDDHPEMTVQFVAVFVDGGMSSAFSEGVDVSGKPEILPDPERRKLRGDWTWRSRTPQATFPGYLKAPSAESSCKRDIVRRVTRSSTTSMEYYLNLQGARQACAYVWRHYSRSTSTRKWDDDWADHHLFEIPWRPADFPVDRHRNVPQKTTNDQDMITSDEPQQYFGENNMISLEINMPDSFAKKTCLRDPVTVVFVVSKLKKKQGDVKITATGGCRVASLERQVRNFIRVETLPKILHTPTMRCVWKWDGNRQEQGLLFKAIARASLTSWDNGFLHPTTSVQVTNAWPGHSYKLNLLRSRSATYPTCCLAAYGWVQAPLYCTRLVQDGLQLCGRDWLWQTTFDTLEYYDRNSMLRSPICAHVEVEALIVKESCERNNLTLRRVHSRCSN